LTADGVGHYLWILLGSAKLFSTAFFSLFFGSFLNLIQNEFVIGLERLRDTFENP